MLIKLNSEQKLQLNLPKGKTLSFEIDALSDQLCSYLETADQFEIEYLERGSGMLIYSDKGRVSFKNLNSTNNPIAATATHEEPSLRTNRNYIIRAGEADELLKAIGIMSPDGKIKNDRLRKYNQIDRYIELVEDMLKEVAAKKDTITILDCACGKSYLSFVLNFYIKEILKKNCYFIGLDINEQVIESSKNMAAELGYKNMEFLATDIKYYEPHRSIDVVISLHGCDIATDLALAAGVRYGAELMIAVPCCQKELLSQIENAGLNAILQHGILKARFSDLLTDGVRTLILRAKGYETSIVEYISPLDTPKNLMIRSRKTQHLDKAALEEYQMLKENFKIDPALARYLYM